MKRKLYALLGKRYWHRWRKHFFRYRDPLKNGWKRCDCEVK